MSSAAATNRTSRISSPPERALPSFRAKSSSAVDTRENIKAAAATTGSNLQSRLGYILAEANGKIISTHSRRKWRLCWEYTRLCCCRCEWWLKREDANLQSLNLFTWLSRSEITFSYPDVLYTLRDEPTQRVGSEVIFSSFKSEKKCDGILIVVQIYVSYKMLRRTNSF